MIYQSMITVDVSGNGARPIVTAKQGDDQSRQIICRLTENGKPFNIPNGVIARIALRKPDNQQVLNDAEIQDNAVVVELTAQMLAAAGNAFCEIMLMQNDALLSSSVFEIRIYPTSYNKSVIESSSEYESFVKALSQVQPCVDLCEQAAEEASSAAQQASAIAQETAGAVAEATAAAQAASTAAQQASAAAQETTDAVAEASSAAQAANSAATQASNAAQTADSAAAEASNAAQAANSAATQASNAAQAASSAATQASNAAQTADSSAAEASTAAQAASSAATQASGAAQTADSAAAEASNAAQAANSAAADASSAAQAANSAAQQIEDAHIDQLIERLGACCSAVSGDLNQITDSGWYCANNAGCTHCPPSESEDLFVLQIYQANNHIIQDAYYCGTQPERYTRTYQQPAGASAFAWTDWYTIPVNVTINGKPLVGDVSLTVADMDVAQNNLLLNSDFSIWQRGSTFMAPRGVYTADRWYCNGIGTISHAVSEDPASNGLKAMGTFTIRQVFEEEDFKKIAGKTVTLSVCQNGTVSYSTYTAIDPVVVDISVSNTTLNWVKLELGSVPTAYTSRPYAIEYLACQRYYQNLTNLFLQSQKDGYWSTSLPVEMRTEPSLSGKYGWSYYASEEEGGTYTVTSGDQAKTNAIILKPNTTASDKYLWTNESVYLSADAEIY